MKIRIKGNALRLRLSMSEVNILCSEHRIEEKCMIGNLSFSYALSVSQTEAIGAIYANGCILVAISNALIQNWASNDVTGFNHIQVNEDGSELFILIEKDFVCLDDSFEDQSDNYPNPNSKC